ncbi:MAG TPA: SAM-dependent methyltransferase [Nocardioidaceae bacterium]
MSWQPWREAWRQALYGPAGFYLHAEPQQHFRTSVHASPLFAASILRLVRRSGLSAVTDYGAGSGELLTQLAHLAPDLVLTGIDLRPRPIDLPASIGWRHELPDDISGLLFANELLDNVPCQVVELDPRGVVRIVEVDSVSGAERLGSEAADAETRWLDDWWPLELAGDRAEVGLDRDEFWEDACGRVVSGMSLALDYGHLQADRPTTTTLRSYRLGRETPVRLDGTADVTAHVAVDSVAAAVRASVRRQRDMLHELGVSAIRPPLPLASTDPAAYVRGLAQASQAAELVDSPGLGDLYWLLAEHSTDTG